MKIGLLMRCNIQYISLTEDRDREWEATIYSGVIRFLTGLEPPGSEIYMELTGRNQSNTTGSFYSSKYAKDLLQGIELLVSDNPTDPFRETPHKVKTFLLTAIPNFIGRLYSLSMVKQADVDVVFRSFFRNIDPSITRRAVASMQSTESRHIISTLEQNGWI